MGTMSNTKGSSAVATSTPRSAVRSSLLWCAERMEYVGQLAAIAADHGRVTHGARYIVDELNDLAADIATLRAHVASAPLTSL